VLIDYENVQPDNLEKLIDLPVRVYVFVGENQTKLTFEFSDAMQRLGDRASYVKMKGNGPNALDFHIAFYAGQLAAADPKGYFHIISKDSGFDPLIAHLCNGRNPRIQIYRHQSIGQICAPAKAKHAATDDHIGQVIEDLHRRSPSLPKKRDSLQNTINALFGKRLKLGEVHALVEALQSRGIVTFEGNEAKYSLPKSVAK
jgi:hypothetical protein